MRGVMGRSELPALEDEFFDLVAKRCLYHYGLRVGGDSQGALGRGGGGRLGEIPMVVDHSRQAGLCQILPSW